MIECVPMCAGPDNPPRYAPAVYRDLVLEFYCTDYFPRRASQGDRPDTA